MAEIAKGQRSEDVESTGLKVPALQIILFEHIKDAIALQAARHVRGKVALVME